MTNFRVGQKVVCVDDNPASGAAYASWRVIDIGLNGLCKGQVYTVREIQVFLNRVLIRLDEIRRPAVGTVKIELGYAPFRFRPAVDQFDFQKLVAPAELEKFKLDESAPKRKRVKASP